MALGDFWDKFDLSIYLFPKLDTLKITGPHVLQFITNQHLVEFGGMDIDELADVQDAQEHWGYGQGNNPDRQVVLVWVPKAKPFHCISMLFSCAQQIDHGIYHTNCCTITYLFCHQNCLYCTLLSSNHSLDALLFVPYTFASCLAYHIA